MKHAYYTLTALLIVQNIAAQTATSIYTPKGSIVPDTYIRPEEVTADDIAHINILLALQYPNAIKLEESTTTYNCHAYAWHVSEGGNKVWIGFSTTTAEDIYWQDGSYIEVENPVEATKVSYASDNHSAVTTPQSDIFISKWGAWPLMKHAKNDCPYTSSVLKYYKKAIVAPTLSGPSIVCDQATFTINNLPAGATVQWNSSNVTRVSPQGSNPCIFSGSISRSGWVEATIITQSGGQITLPRHTVWVGIPTNNNILFGVFFQPAPNDQVPISQDVFIGVAHNSDAATQMVTGYVWEFMSWKPYVKRIEEYLGYNNARATIFLTNNATPLQIVQVSACNACGYNPFMGAAKMFYAVNTYSLALIPDPATDMVTVELQEIADTNASVSRETTTSISGEYEIQLWDMSAMLRSFTTDQSPYQISISGLPAGTYFVHVIKDGKTYTKKLVKE